MPQRHWPCRNARAHNSAVRPAWAASEPEAACPHAVSPAFRQRTSSRPDRGFSYALSTSPFCRILAKTIPVVIGGRGSY
jgi:hypothetical protein